MPDLWLFFPAAILVTLSPGPDNMQVLARGMSQGRSAGLVAALGFSMGTLLHTGLAVLGVATLLATYPLAFDLIRYAGAIYLLWLAWGAFRSQSTFGERSLGQSSLLKIYKQSILGCALNPKVSLFFLVFFPQFIRPDQGSASIQLLILGVAFMFQAWVIFSMLAIFSGVIRSWLLQKPHRTRYLDRLAGCVFVLVAAKIGFNI